MIINFPIKIYPFNLLNNKHLKNELIKYLKENKCCINYPKCIHPKEQSASDVFEINNKTIKELKEKYYDCIKNLIKNYKIIYTKSWIFFSQKNKNLPGIWHKHFDEKYKKDYHLQISGLCYITPTNIGTEFRNEFFNIEILPKINHWYLWDSFLEHRPKDVVSPENRMVVATATVLEIL